MRRYSALLLLCTMLVGCEKPKSVVVIDDWYIADFTKSTCASARSNLKHDADLIRKFGCDQVTACPELTHIADACANGDGVAEARQFERAIKKEFALNDECSSVEVFTFSGPGSSSHIPQKSTTRWTLIVDFHPGADAQDWWISGSGAPTGLEGRGNAAQIGKEVCAIISRKGADVKS